MALLMMNTIGLAVVIDACRSAMYYVTHTGCLLRNNYQKETMKKGSSALAFIEGSGLDIVLNTYYLHFDPDSLRNVFHFTAKKIQNKVSNEKIH